MCSLFEGRGSLVSDFLSFREGWYRYLRTPHIRVLGKTETGETGRSTETYRGIVRPVFAFGKLRKVFLKGV